MKKYILSLFFATLIASVFGQAPGAFNYQAVVRSSDGKIMASTNIVIKIELVAISSNVVVYSEVHSCTTSSLGLVNLEIGRGETSGNIENVSWNSDQFLIQVSYDLENGNNFTLLGSSQLLSVPYALFAANASKQQLSINGNVITLSDGGQITLPTDQVNDADADATNELQALTKDGNLLNISKNTNAQPVDLSEYKDNTDAQTLTVADGKLKISGGNEIEISSLQSGTDSDAQTLSLNNQKLTISNGNTIDLSAFMDNTDHQQLSLANDTLYLSNGNKVYLGRYADNSDNQTLSLSGKTLAISGGNTVDLSSVDSKLTEPEVDAMVANNGYLTSFTEVDGSVTNEIQDLQLTGSKLKITNNPTATEINLAPFTGNDTDDQTLSLSGTTLTIVDGNSVDLAVLQDGTTDADADPDNEIQQLSISGNIISLTDGGTVTLPDGFSGNYNDLSNKPALANVATSGSYSDLTAKPDFTGWDTNASNDFSGSYNDLSNKPVLAGDVTGATGLTTVEKIRGMNVSANIPGNGQILKWNSTTLTWEPSDDQLGAAGSTDGVVSSIGVTGTTTKTITLNRTNGLSSLTATFTDNVDDADANPTNEIQDLSISGNTLSLTSDATTVSLAPYLDNTDNQSLSLTGTTLAISGGNSVNLSSIDTKLTETEVDAMVANNGYLTSEVDGSTTNEIQNLTLTGTTLAISGGNTVNLSSIDTKLTEAEVDAFVSNNGYLTSEADGSATNELQTISLAGSTITLSNSGGTVTLPDASATNEIQDLSLSGNTLALSGDASTVNLAAYMDNTDSQNLSVSGSILTISGGNSVTLPISDNQTLYFSGTTLEINRGNNVDLSSLKLNETDVDAMVADNGYITSEVDASTTNELQTISISGSSVTLSNSGGTITLPDASSTNEIQDLNLSGNTLSLSGDATTVSLATYLDNTDSQTLSISGNVISLSNGGSVTLPAEADGSTTNEIQDLSLSGNTLALSDDATSVSLAAYLDNTDSQTLSISGNVISLSNGGSVTLPAEADGSTTNEIQDLSLSGNILTLSGDATTVSLAAYLDNTDSQALSISGSVISLSNGGSVTLPAVVDGSITNEIQTLSLSGSSLSISGTGGNTVSLTSLASPFTTTSNVTSNANGTYASDDFVFGSSTLYYSAEGSRFFFDKSKSAFRAGYCTNTNWNDSFCGNYSFGGGSFAKASGDYSTAFGQNTAASGGWSFAAGYQTTASFTGAVAFGYGTIASSTGAVAMGITTEATQTGAVAFGDNTNATGPNSLVSGDRTTASGTNSVAMGMQSVASGEASFAIGEFNSATGICSISLGYGAQSTGNYSTAIGYNAYNWGVNSLALGENAKVESGVTYSTAIGRYARAYYNGQLVACDGGSASSTWGGTDNSFYAKFRGGYYFYTNAGATVGVYLAAGATSWAVASDSTKKENFKAVNGEDFLNKISQFKLTSWNYKGQDAKLFRHYGPMAQDFYSAFGNDGIGTVGCDTMIATADFQGINFIAIQALEKRTAELKQTQIELTEKINQVNELKALLEEQKNQINDVKKMKAELTQIKELLGIEVSVK